jgi:outer membrane protein
VSAVRPLRAGLCALALALAPATLSAETLADTLADAYRNSNLLEQNRALLRAADEDAAQAVSALRPVLAFIAQANYADPALGEELTASVALSAEMTLFDFGTNRLGVEVARETVLATRQALLSLEQEVLLAAVQAYADVFSAAEFVNLREANVRLIGEELRAAQDRFEVGEVTRTDVSIAEARLAAARANLAAAEGDLEVARESFRLAVGRLPDGLAQPGRAPSVPGSLEEAIEIALRTHPSIRQSQHEVKAAELNIERAQRVARGRITGEAQVGVNDEGDDFTSLGLTFRQPIYQGGLASSAYRQAIARRDAARSALLQARLGVEARVAQAWAQLEVTIAQIEASERQIRASSVAFEGVQEEARLGARTTLDVLDAEQELLDARTARIDAGARQVVAVYALLGSMGLLNVEHLGLGVPVYDPSQYYDAVKNAPPISLQGQRLDRVLEEIGQE